MSDREKDAGITDSSDIDTRSKYKDVQTYQPAPTKMKVEKNRNQQRAVPIK